MMDINAAGGTWAPFIFDWLTCDSIPNVKAECMNPLSCRYR